MTNLDKQDIIIQSTANKTISNKKIENLLNKCILVE